MAIRPFYANEPNLRERLESTLLEVRESVTQELLSIVRFNKSTDGKLNAPGIKEREACDSEFAATIADLRSRQTLFALAHQRQMDTMMELATDINRMLDQIFTTDEAVQYYVKPEMMLEEIISGNL